MVALLVFLLCRRELYRAKNCSSLDTQTLILQDLCFFFFIINETRQLCLILVSHGDDCPLTDSEIRRAVGW